MSCLLPVTRYRAEQGNSVQHSSKQINASKNKGMAEKPDINFSKHTRISKRSKGIKSLAVNYALD